MSKELLFRTHFSFLCVNSFEAGLKVKFKLLDVKDISRLKNQEKNYFLFVLIALVTYMAGGPLTEMLSNKHGTFFSPGSATDRRCLDIVKRTWLQQVLKVELNLFYKRVNCFETCDLS